MMILVGNSHNARRICDQCAQLGFEFECRAAGSSPPRAASVCSASSVFSIGAYLKNAIWKKG